jgi:hypothetical protein
MSTFIKSASQITASDLDQLLQEKAIENIGLEFKREEPDKDQMLKKLSSFANTFGGRLIVGADANSDDGVLKALPGIEPVNTYKQKVVAWCAEALMPPLQVDVSNEIVLSNGKVAYVVQVEASDEAPHFMIGRKGVYIRTNEFSKRFGPKLADEGELRGLLNRRQAIRERRAALVERARRRFQTFRSQSRHKMGAWLDLAVVPRFPARPLCDQIELLSLSKSKRLETNLGFLPN